MGAASVEAGGALAALLARAGASDQERELWLAERRTGVTATEVRDLMLKGASFRRELIEKKLGQRADAFGGNQYTAWGNLREPEIAKWVQRRFMLTPETRVFRAADNSRFLASPDGVGEDFEGNLLVDEIKTSKHDISPGSAHYEAVGYLYQQTWSMRVTGARRCLYVWEQHDDDWSVDRGGPFLEPAPLWEEPRAQWIYYDPQLAAKLEQIALDFLAELDEARRALDAGEGRDIDDAIDTAAVNYLRFIAEEKSAATAKKGAYDDILAAVGHMDSFSQEGTTARVTLTPMKSERSTVVDEDAAREADPKLWARVEKVQAQWAAHVADFAREVEKTTGPRLTITPVKVKETGK